jgi:membrane protein DedA with SNARE-associated domain
MGIPLWQFLIVDGTAALISVPTQVYFVAKYGDVILDKIKQFKMMLAAFLGVLIIVWLMRKLYLKIKARRVA